MIYDTYVISCFNTERDLNTIKERLFWNLKNSTEDNLIIKIKFPKENIDEFVKIDATDEIKDTKKLTIGILTTYSRINYALRLFLHIRKYFNNQNYSDEIEFLLNVSMEDIKVGKKRNDLIKFANSDYFCFIDDDDLITENYFSKIITSLSYDVDAVGIMGRIHYLKTKKIIPFIHSTTQYTNLTKDTTKSGKFLLLRDLKEKFNTIKYPLDDDTLIHLSLISHLCPIRLNLIKEIQFKEINYGEDIPWFLELLNKKIIKKEAFINEIIYEYLYEKE